MNPLSTEAGPGGPPAPVNPPLPSAGSAVNKVLTRFIIPLAIFVVVIVGITFVSQYLPSQKKPDKEVKATKATLIFPIKTVTWDPSIQDYVAEFEKGSGGTYSFFFQNVKDQAMELGLTKKSCTCSQVEVCLLDDAGVKSMEDIKRLQEYMRAAQAWPSVSGTLGVANLVNLGVSGSDGFGGILGKRLNWKNLSDPNDRSEVPAGTAGLVRLTWKPKKKQNDQLRLTVELWTQIKGQRKTRSKAELAAVVAFVPPIRTFPQEIVIKDWDSAGVGVTDFMCWSATHASFPLRAFELENDPCVEVDAPIPLSGIECNELENQLRRSGTNTRVLSGYHIRVIMHQTREHKAKAYTLERGQLRRWIGLRSAGLVAPTNVKITAQIQETDVHVGKSLDGGTIRMGSFPAGNGKSTTVPLITGPGVELQPTIEKNPSYIKVDLKKKSGGGGSETYWQLRVTIPADPPGGWQDDSAIILHTKPRDGKPSRRIRIPIWANPYQ